MRENASRGKCEGTERVRTAGQAREGERAWMAGERDHGWRERIDHSRAADGGDSKETRVCVLKGWGACKGRLSGRVPLPAGPGAITACPQGGGIFHDIGYC